MPNCDRCQELEKQKADLQAKLEESKPLGHLCNEIVSLQAELQHLRTENAALRRPVRDEEADSFSRQAQQDIAEEYGCSTWQSLADLVSSNSMVATDVLMDLASMESVRLAFASRSQEAQKGATE